MDKKPQKNKLTQTESGEDLYEIQSDDDDMLIPLSKSHSISHTAKKIRRVIKPQNKNKSSSSAKKLVWGR